MRVTVEVTVVQAEGAVVACREVEGEDEGMIEETVTMIMARHPREAPVAAVVQPLVHHGSLLRPVIAIVSHACYRCWEVSKLSQTSTHHNRGPRALYEKRCLGQALQPTLRQADYLNVTVGFPQTRSK